MILCLMAGLSFHGACHSCTDQFRACHSQKPAVMECIGCTGDATALLWHQESKPAGVHSPAELVEDRTHAAVAHNERGASMLSCSLNAQYCNTCKGRPVSLVDTDKLGGRRSDGVAIIPALPLDFACSLRQTVPGLHALQAAGPW